MQRTEQQCTAIDITQQVDPRQGYGANDKEERGGGLSGLSMRITQHERRRVRKGTATSAESKLANRAERWAFVEGHAFFRSLPPRHLQGIFLIYFSSGGIHFAWVDSKQHLYFWLLWEQSYSKSLSSQASSDDRCPEGLERKIHFI